MADAKQGKAPNEDFHNGPSQTRAVLAKPRLGGFSSSNFGSSSSKSCNPFSSVLRPPQLKPISNPFLKAADLPDNREPKSDKTETPNEDRLKETKEEVPKFVPLGSSNVSSRANTVPVPQPAASSSGFVFGQNLSERVVMAKSVNNGDASSVDHSSTNGTSELLFSSAAASVKENNQEEAGPSETRTGSGSEGLAAAAAEYERSHARPPPLPTNNVTTTGEEGETNVLQISCRLFAWESGSWRERGRGLLRLNDSAQGGQGARLVVRVVGSLRVALNTKLWPDMVVQLAGSKSLRITATDAQNQVKLFLIMGAPGDIIQLHRAITARLTGCKRSISSNTCTQNSTSHKAAERLEADTDDSEYFDKPDEECAEMKNNESSVHDIDDNAKVDDVDEGELDKNERLETKSPTKTEDIDFVDCPEDKDSKSLKRKESAEEETSNKRQCPEIVIE
ncbi:hypothetical protein K1T71_004639 [Dendrolimus kikuchii]|uniref:Uncharacterized protein n=1 Tax=Dendrolimus kikuchii TaxID=765133 RepID=A0ACC1D800_9NEOP|nr:hypothetical protein K1T71_004639 [Dendrolimus kikuchii]